MANVLSELAPILLGRLLGENIELKLEKAAATCWPVKADLSISSSR